MESARKRQRDDGERVETDSSPLLPQDSTSQQHGMLSQESQCPHSPHLCCLRPPTHDTSNLFCHKAGSVDITKELQQAVNLRPSKYKEAHVLLIYWKEDDLGVKKEVEDLDTIFIKSYGYRTTKCELGSESCFTDLSRSVMDLRSKGSRDSLLIVFYAGHACKSESGILMWASKSENSSMVDSSIVRSHLQNLESDVLFIYDCCYPYFPPDNIAAKGVKEVLTAVGFDGKAASVGKRSFTNALVEELGCIAALGSPQTIAEVHARVTRRLASWMRSLQRDDQNRLQMDPEGRILMEKYETRAPNHYRLTTDRRCIVLAPLSSQATDTGTPGTSMSSTMSNDKADHTRYTSLQVIICFRLARDEFDIKPWIEWIQSLPKELRNAIKIEGAYRSCSTLVLIRMPIMLWDMLPDSRAASFVGFVSGENQALGFQEQIDRAVEKEKELPIVAGSDLMQGKPLFWNSGDDLASRYRNEGRWKEVEVPLLQVTDGRERAEHLQTLTIMENLASGLNYQYYSVAAIQLQEQVIEAKKRVLGEEHLDTLTSMENLVFIQKYHLRSKEAIELQVQVVEAKKRVLGEKYPGTLTSMENLASLHRDESQWEEAIKLQAQVIETRKRLLGKEYPDTLTSMENLALIHGDQCQWEEAIEIQAQVMEARQRVLGEEHPDTLTSMEKLALIHFNWHNWEEAVRLQEQVIEARQRVLGERHLDTLASMENLVLIHREQGMYEGADELGEGPLDTQNSIDDLASMHRNKDWWGAKR